MKIDITDMLIDDVMTVNIVFKDKKLKIAPAEFIMTGNLSKDSVAKFMQEFVTLNAVTAHIAQQIAEAKLGMDLREAQLDTGVRSAWDVDKNGKMTEAGVKAVIEGDPKIQDAKQFIIQLTAVKSTLEILISAGLQKYNVLAASNITHIPTN